MRILLFGHRGQVGTELKNHFPAEFQLFPSNIDITDRSSIENEVGNIHPDVVINAAAYTSVDEAEIQKEKAFEVNAIAPMRLANIALKTNALLVHYSTDYVFDGSGYAPWTENDTPAPLNVYGSTKLEGDQQIINSGCRHLILRTSWVYGLNRDNFIRSILKQAHSKNNISVISDQIGSPTSAKFLAQSTYVMIKDACKNKDLLGLYNITTQGEISWAEYARFIIEKSGLLPSINITPVLSKYYPQLATRPLNSRLDTTKIQKDFGIIPPNWKQGVLDYLQTIHQELKE